MAKDPAKTKPTAAFKVGAISLVFLVIGYQIALFVHRTAILSIVAHRDEPDTVYVYVDGGGNEMTERRDSPHSVPAAKAYREFAPRRYESFPFNPNTASQEEFQRLGFSEKQAASIIKYRQSGGKFRRKSDFAKSYVVEDSVFQRLEPFIDIPLLDLNKADSAAFDALPGIGPYFAAKMVSYRKELGGYSFPEQLMDIYHFDKEKFDALKDLVCCTPSDAKPLALWTLPADSLRLHPYIRNWNVARAIVLYRENTPVSERSIQGLAEAGIISEEIASKLSRIPSL